MNKIFSLSTLILLSLTWLPIPAQDENPANAYLKVINLIDTGEPTFISLNGHTFKRGNPIAPGFTTGAFELEPGSHSVTMENTGADKGKMNVSLSLKPGGTYGLLCFTETDTKKDAEGNPVEFFKMKYTILEGRDQIGQAKLTVFSLAKSETIQINIKGSPYRIAQKNPVEVKVRVGETVSVTGMDGTDIGAVEIISPFHYVGFIDDKANDGSLRFTFFEQRSYTSTPLDTMEEEVEPKEEKTEAEVKRDEVR